jgi:hypothetical protein
MKTIPRPNQYVEHGQAVHITKTLAGALDQWLYRPDVAVHTWLLGGWRVSSDTPRPHVDITTPGGSHIGLYRVDAPGVLAVLKEFGAPLNLRGVGEAGYSLMEIAS